MLYSNPRSSLGKKIDGQDARFDVNTRGRLKIIQLEGEEKIPTYRVDGNSLFIYEAHVW